MKTRFTIALAAFLLTIGAATAYARKLYATFGTPANNASYDDATETYSWTLGYSNLMPVFTFANGKLANYKTLSFTFSDYKVESGSGGVRIGVYHTTDGGGSTWKQMGYSFMPTERRPSTSKPSPKKAASTSPRSPPSALVAATEPVR